MKHFISLFGLLLSLQSFGQTTDTLIHINVNRNFNYACTDCPDSTLVVVDSVFVVDSLFVTVYDTISTGGGAYTINRTTSVTYTVGSPAMYIYEGSSPAVFTLPTGTDPISGLDYLFVNSGTSQVVIEEDTGPDLIVIDPGMIFNAIWNKQTWNIY